MSEVQNDLETAGRYLSANQSEQLYSRGFGPTSRSKSVYDIAAWIVFPPCRSAMPSSLQRGSKDLRWPIAVALSLAAQTTRSG